MRLLFFVAVALLVPGCTSNTSKEFGSDCTNEPITIQASRRQQSATSAIEPFLYMRRKGFVLTIGRYDALAILSERAKENAIVAKAVSLLLPRLEALPRSDKAVDVDSIRPKLEALKGQELNDGVLIENELNVLFLRALLKGVAVIDGEGKSYDTVVQQYTASLKDGNVNGVRILLGDKIVNDYCGITPKRP